MEWASIYRDFGSEVTLVEYLDRVVPLEDADVSKELSRVFRKRGIAIYASSSIDPETIERTEERPAIHGRRPRGREADGGGART